MDHVLSVLNKHDLAGVEPGKVDGAPLDEYLNEALPLAGLLLNGRSLERSDVVRTWKHWFDDDLSWLADEAWTRLLADLNSGPRQSVS